MQSHHPARSANGIKIAKQLTASPQDMNALKPAHILYSYGVSRVFSQQCGYVLSDAQVAQNNMRALLKAVRTSELDPDAGKAR